jgi:maltose alpha-D-glucosyltransferase/alpha-amylase
MLRSFAYARRAALQKEIQVAAEQAQRLQPLLDKWEQETRQKFLATYDEVARAGGLYASLEEMRPLLHLFEIEKALYEVRYELGNRPDWASIPLRSLIGFAE